MAKTAKIETKLTGDATGLKRELQVAKTEVGRYARDVTERLKAINAAVQSINIVAQISAIVGIAKQGIALYNQFKSWIEGAGRAARASADEAEAAARKLADAASKTGFSPAQFAAIQEAAARANVPAGELNDILSNIAKNGGGLREVADALGTTADNLERGAAAAGRAYVAARESRRGAAAEAAKNAAADEAGIREMVGQLLDKNGDIDAVASDVVAAFANVPNAFGAVMDEVEAEYERRRSAAQGPDDGPLAGASGWTPEEGNRGFARAVLNSTRSVADVASALEPRFDALLKQARAKREAAARAAEDAERARLGAVIAETVPEYNPYAAHAEAERHAAAAKAAEEKAAEEKARRQVRRDEILVQMGEARDRRDAEIAALTVAPPTAINSLNSVGGLIGSDPTAQNVMAMEKAVIAKMDVITRKFDESIGKLQKALDLLSE